MPEGLPHRSWTRDLAVIGAVFAVCPVVALLAPTQPDGPVAAGRAVLELERGMGIAAEASASQWLAAQGALATVLSLIYVWAHVPATIGALIWCRLERPARFGQALTAVVLAQALTIAVYLAWPVAPPRLADPGVVDGVAGVMGAEVGGLSGVLQSPYAAMPSGHVAFATLVAAILLRERLLVLRAVGVGYAAVVTLIVVLTGNHYLLDVVAGFAVALAAWTLAGRSFDPAGLAARLAQSTRTKATPPSTSTSKVSTG